METASLSADRVLLLGPLQVIQNGVPLNQPPSRKVRALLGYLAMAPRPVTREKLCELFWDVADDPRSELRWCLSKLRPLVDRPTTTRIVADRKQVWIDTSSLDIDAQSVARRTQRTLAELFTKRASVAIGFVQGRFSRGPFGRRGSIVRKLARRPAAPLRSVAPTASRTAHLRPAAGER